MSGRRGLFSLLVLSACTVGEPPPSSPALAPGQTVTSRFGEVEAVARFESAPDRIVSTLTGADTSARFSLVWTLDDGRIELQTETGSVAVAIEDVRPGEPSLAGANQLAHELWREQAGGESVAYLLWDGSCPNGHLRCLEWSVTCYPILECWPEPRCETVVICTPDGCTETQQCHDEVHCSHRNYCTEVCNEWGCETDIIE